MRESEIEAYLVERVKVLGGEVRKLRWIGRNGAPDRVVMLPTKGVPYFPLGAPVEAYAEWLEAVRKYVDERLAPPNARSTPPRTIWVELKAPGEKCKPHQAREHVRMRRMGQEVVVVDSLEGVDGLLGGS